MTDFQQQYRAAKQELEAIAVPLMDLGESLVRQHGVFLPLGARLTPTGECVLVGAAPEEDIITADVVLPLVIEALEAETRAHETRAIATVEWVTITDDAGTRTDAIKTAVQHRDGVTVAFYVPASQSSDAEWTFGATVVQRIGPLTPRWPSSR